MERYLTLEAVRLTEAASLNASRHMGKGDEEICYESAMRAMHQIFSTMNIDGSIVIGADSSESPLCDGAKVGMMHGDVVDLAVKPLDGKTTCAKGGHNALSVIAVGNRGAFLEVPSMYMEKIAVGKEAKNIIDITQPVDINIKRVARAKGKYIEDITVCVLDRKNNLKLVEDIRKTGAKISFITDGDISGAISTAFENNPIDILMGIGGAKEGILAASALKCLDGDIQAKFIFSNSRERKVIESNSGGNPDRVFTITDMIRDSDDIMVSLTGVTDGVLLSGVRYYSGGAETSSILLRQKTHTMRYIKTNHSFDFKPIF